MKSPLAGRDPNTIMLVAILVLGAVLRFYGLANQSFWVDELHSVNEADPSISWNEMFHLINCCDPHPPLFFIIERLVISVFGSSEFIARGFPALCGLVTVWTMYLLGKELVDKKLGLIAALLTSVNYFNIDYSQEARNYTLVMLFATLSFLYFIKLLKDLRRRNLFLYVLFSILMLYSHYFSLFIVTAQGLVAFLFLIGVKEGRKQFLITFAIAGVLLAVGYLPWVPFLLDTAKINSFWIGPIPPDFAISFFFEYFGDYQKLKPFQVVMILYFFWELLKQRNWSLPKMKETPIQLMFIVFFTAIAVTYGIPYIRSITVVPMLHIRYTIVVLPAFILILAFAFYLVKNRPTQTVLLTGFVLLSLHDVVNHRKFYYKDTRRKTQFREMTEFISQNQNMVIPIVEERTAWQHAYYLKRYNNAAPVLTGNKEATIDSILHKTSAKYDLETFWIVGAHGFERHLDTAMRTKLDSSYTLIVEQDFFDAWAQLFMKIKAVRWNVTSYFPGLTFINDYEEVIPVWMDIPVNSQPIPIKPGKYKLIFLQRGTRAHQVYPRINVFLNEQKIGDYTGTEYNSEKILPFEVANKESMVIRLDFDNVSGGEDRNEYIRSIIVEGVGKQQ